MPACHQSNCKAFATALLACRRASDHVLKQLLLLQLSMSREIRCCVLLLQMQAHMMPMDVDPETPSSWLCIQGMDLQPMSGSPLR